MPVTGSSETGMRVWTVQEGPGRTNFHRARVSSRRPCPVLQNTAGMLGPLNLGALLGRLGAHETEHSLQNPTVNASASRLSFGCLKHHFRAGACGGGAVAVPDKCETAISPLLTVLPAAGGVGRLRVIHTHAITPRRRRR